MSRYQAGQGIKAIAAELGMHHRTVRTRLLAAGVTLRPQAPTLTPRQITKAAELYAQGWTIKRLASHYGVSHTSIRRYLEKRDVTMRPMVDVQRTRQSPASPRPPAPAG